MFFCRPMLAVALLVFLPGAHADPQEWLDCLGANAPDRSFSGELTLVTSAAESAGETLKTRALGEKRGPRLNLNLKITEPSNLAGTAFLLQEQNGQDSMHVYLPGLRKTRRVTGSMGNQELWGTSFSYSDIKQLFGAFAEGSFSDGGEQSLDDRPAHLLRLVPSPALEADYATMHLWIWPEECVLAGMDLLSADERVLKSLRATREAIIEQGDARIPTRWTMQDFVTERSTVATLANLQYEAGISPAAFNVRGFENVR